jgi:uncharacterized repeat protein (TIGR04138 family)
MTGSFETSLMKVVESLGDYPLEAYLFLREGLSFAVQDVHGPETPAQLTVMKYLAENCIDLSDLEDLHLGGMLSVELREAIEEAGGIDGLNRHVSGGQLCWGLRDYSLRRWGMLAQMSLAIWNITCTYDFGRMVFGMIDNELMQKQPNDDIEDFRDVYDFSEAFASCNYSIEIPEI